MHTILIADDNAASRELLRDTLEDVGALLIEASNGQEALEAILEFSPQVALLDIQMPLLDGFGVVERVRALEPPPAIHLIALTALAMESDRQRILAAGFDGYVAKPISVSGLRTLVTRVLSGLEDDGHPFPQKTS
jgi:two-component system cell cycle response regulator DivK